MLRFILFFFLGPVPVSCFRCCRFSLWEREFQAVDTPVSLRGNCCSLAWKLLFPYVDTVVSLRVYSCFLAWKLPVSVAEAEAAPGACYGNSV
ncbi:hypothetical protein PO070_15540 [Bacteroides stercoris]|uniref:hypothetical protein n=1 Tax=Bacteroides TaxID=816 RepID=UPI00058D8760|nr:MULTISPECIES: hypothetical protein [Bacteroides]MBC5610397.1 hypothetical protein [Bacteroides sp. NSJ-48]MBV3810028.1 hypothetical protein [Bacteroides stercoris]MDC2283868.1 hypothetical protein [Bacteroides stercoris]MDC2297632.1 hypothetical protein [Bacteroides stercoris]MDC2313899.1 hypothetical protein [Bacteroides stercoris]